MNNDKLLTLTIGIPAHNEASNIAFLLHSIVKQKKSNLKLERVIVACDGCTDNTVDIVRNFSKKYKYISVIDDGLRKGQARRLNDFYDLCKSDIFLTFDADVKLGSLTVLEEIVSIFGDIKSNNIGLVGGKGTPEKAKNFFGKTVVSRINFWYQVTKDVNDGENVHNHLGCVSAMSRRMYSKVRILPELVANDNYLYFMARKLGFDFRFAARAVVYYKAPDNINDYLLQFNRFLSSEEKVENYFGDLARTEYHVPFHSKLKALIFLFLKDPVTIFFVLFFQLILKLSKFKYYVDNSSGVWTTVKSSK